MENTVKLPRMRNINKAYEMLKSEDPDTIITKHQIKLIVYSGKIPIYTVGNRKFFDYDLFRSYIAILPITMARIFAADSISHTESRE